MKKIPYIFPSIDPWCSPARQQQRQRQRQQQQQEQQQ